MLNTLRSRLLFSYLLVAFICLSVTGCLLLALVGPLQNQLTYSRLLDRAIPTALWVRELLRRDVSPLEIVQRRQDQMESEQSRMLLAGLDGTILADSDNILGGTRVDRFDFREVLPNQWPVRGQWRVSAGARYFFLSLPATDIRSMRQPLPDNTVFVILATLNRPRVMLDVLPMLLIAVLAGFLVSILLAFLIARWISWPLRRMSHAAGEIALGNYDQTVDISSPEEAKSLADSFNYMVAQVKASQESQRDFVANVSHELRTPLTSIQGFAQAILDGTATDTTQQQQAAQIIKDEAERMARLVEDLLALAKISADRDRSTWTELDVSALMEACVQRMTVLADKRDIRFQLKVSPTPHVKGNPDRLAQVFTNLLDNAIKHSPEGGEITVTTSPVSDSVVRHAPKWVEITVADRGPGIPPQDLTRIFERFYQVDKSRSGERSGAGLGLAIVHEIIEAHQGQLRAENRPGSGALFSVVLPAV